ncbi:MAG: leucine--tRNA ligase [Puniceicoccales bacterium]|nr:leucine--tRNA ligase [Puniceicoccales bacterium]
MYPFGEIESKWQRLWDWNGTFIAVDGDCRPKYYVLDMFPYPSGAGLHIGHPEGYTASDILARYHWANGYNVLHPMGWDAFGLPAEQHALQTGISPKLNTDQNVARFRGQIRRMGFAIDWTREINTTDQCYYRWTQWIFLQLFKRGLAFVDERPVWWCGALKAVLSNEEVVGGKSERGSHAVERRLLRQWVLRITAYADRLLDGLGDLDWPDSTKRQQIAWIGRSEGVEIDFAVDGSCGEVITVYSTRADTIMGATYLVLAPEHPAVKKITAPTHCGAVEKYCVEAARKGDLERTDLAKDKTGAFTGAYATHPLSGEKLPIWIADYVLPSYGTGAVMAVPAHDDRDYEFAKRFNLPMRVVVAGGGELPFCGYGTVCGSGQWLDGLECDGAKAVVLQKLKEKSAGRGAVKYKLRDWLFSRQRYWGEPIPIVWVRESDYGVLLGMAGSPYGEFLPEKPVCYEEAGEKFYAVPLPLEQLPLILPEVDDYRPSDCGESPLAKATDWVEAEINFASGQVRPRSAGGADGWVLARRETNTMPQWAGSCWYHLRYLSPNCLDAPVSREAEAYWGCPDFYIGGAEHAVLHLLYARFWHQFLCDIGVVTKAEPYPKLFHQGIILGEDGNKMSKSRGNVVNPDRVIGECGADALRVYEMFLGPLDAVKPWDSRGIGGPCRFLRRVWQLYVGADGGLSGTFSAAVEESDETDRMIHCTIRKVREDIELLHFNTALSQLMVALNHLQKLKKISIETGEIFLQLLAPFAPHLAEELWEKMGHGESIVRAQFPNYDVSKLSCALRKIVVQVNGKLRGELQVSQDASGEEIINLARSAESVIPHLVGRELADEVYVPGRLVNFVVRN